MDLNIDNYSLDDIFQLFQIKKRILDNETMKYAKSVVLKSHPDRGMYKDPKYFIFYSSAYKKLYGIYEFQNKSTKKIEQETYEPISEGGEDENTILNQYFQKNKDEFQNSGDFNKWFNEKFDAYHEKNEADKMGYGSWLKSDEGIKKIQKQDLEAYKLQKQKESMVLYRGYNELASSTLGGSGFGGTMIYSSGITNFSTGKLFGSGGGTDLKQAYEESVIPITEDVYDAMPKFNSVDEYRRYREKTEEKPPDQVTAQKILEEQQIREEEESIARAFELAKQTERAQKKKTHFWKELKTLIW